MEGTEVLTDNDVLLNSFVVQLPKHALKSTVREVNGWEIQLDSIRRRKEEQEQDFHQSRFATKRLYSCLLLLISLIHRGHYHTLQHVMLQSQLRTRLSAEEMKEEIDWKWIYAKHSFICWLLCHVLSMQCTTDNGL